MKNEWTDFPIKIVILTLYLTLGIQLSKALSNWSPTRGKEGRINTNTKNKIHELKVVKRTQIEQLTLSMSQKGHNKFC